jgi:putative lipoic acid-binding regulatory protein
VIALNTEAVGRAVRAAAEQGQPAPLGSDAYQVVASSGGKYLSHRLSVPCRTSEDVLRLYARMRAIDGVITVL